MFHRKAKNEVRRMESLHERMVRLATAHSLHAMPWQARPYQGMLALLPLLRPPMGLPSSGLLPHKPSGSRGARAVVARTQAVSCPRWASAGAWRRWPCSLHFCWLVIGGAR